jgi:hypothetical protein
VHASNLGAFISRVESGKTRLQKDKFKKALITLAHFRIFLIKLSNCIKRERALLKYIESIQEKHLTKKSRKIKKISKKI